MTTATTSTATTSAAVERIVLACSGTGTDAVAVAGIETGIDAGADAGTSIAVAGSAPDLRRRRPGFAAACAPR
jgi:hypothetical protein